MEAIYITESEGAKILIEDAISSSVVSLTTLISGIMKFLCIFYGVGLGIYSL